MAREPVGWACLLGGVIDGGCRRRHMVSGVIVHNHMTLVSLNMGAATGLLAAFVFSEGSLAPRGGDSHAAPPFYDPVVRSRLCFGIFGSRGRVARGDFSWRQFLVPTLARIIRLYYGVSHGTTHDPAMARHPVFQGGVPPAAETRSRSCRFVDHAWRQAQTSASGSPGVITEAQGSGRPSLTNDRCTKNRSGIHRGSPEIGTVPARQGNGHPAHMTISPARICHAKAVPLFSDCAVV